MQDAFLANMNDQSVIDANGVFVKGLPVYAKQSKDTSGKLSWRPDFAAIAAAGDFGYTTGPWVYAENGKQVASGNYATVWQKQTDGQWKFLIDLGNSYDRPPITKAEKKVQLLLPDKDIAAVGGSLTLMMIDSLFDDLALRKTDTAYPLFSHPSAHLLRPGKAPYISAVAKQQLFAVKQAIAFYPEQSYTASTHDLGVVYGTCKTPLQTGIYMHVWRKDKIMAWQLLHETIKW